MIVSCDQQQADAKEVAESIMEKVNSGECTQIFAVRMDARGAFSLEYSGNWHNLAIASKAMSCEFDRHMDGVYD